MAACVLTIRNIFLNKRLQYRFARLASTGSLLDQYATVDNRPRHFRTPRICQNVCLINNIFVVVYIAYSLCLYAQEVWGFTTWRPSLSSKFRIQRNIFRQKCYGRVHYAISQAQPPGEVTGWLRRRMYDHSRQQSLASLHLPLSYRQTLCQHNPGDIATDFSPQVQHCHRSLIFSNFSCCHQPPYVLLIPLLMWQMNLHKKDDSPKAP